MPSASTKQSAGQSGAGDGTSVTKRLKTELTQLMMSGDNSVSAFPEGDNLFSWIGTITGSPGTVYEGLSFKLSLKFPSGNGACYPYSPPVVKFETPCFHPNVDQHGNICLDILKAHFASMSTDSFTMAVSPYGRFSRSCDGRISGVQCTTSELCCSRFRAC